MTVSVLRRIASGVVSQAGPRKALTGAAVAAVATGAVFAAAPAQAATGSESSARTIAHKMIPDAAQYKAFSNIVKHESGWDVDATNASSGAYGLVQALPGSKMASAGPDWEHNAATQIKWGLEYIKSSYGTPCGAWSFKQGHNWY